MNASKAEIDKAPIMRKLTFACTAGVLLVFSWAGGIAAPSVAGAVFSDATKETGITFA